MTRRTRENPEPAFKANVTLAVLTGWLMLAGLTQNPVIGARFLPWDTPPLSAATARSSVPPLRSQSETAYAGCARETLAELIYTSVKLFYSIKGGDLALSQLCG
jgi:hypothetical protein